MRTVTMLCLFMLAPLITAQELKLPEIEVDSIKTGEHYSVDRAFGKVVSITDKGVMIIEIADNKEKWKKKQTIVVLCEFPVRVKVGRTDQLDRLLGSSYVTVAAPRRYYYRSEGKTVPSPKVFLLRPYSGRN